MQLSSPGISDIPSRVVHEDIIESGLLEVDADYIDAPLCNRFMIIGRQRVPSALMVALSP